MKVPEKAADARPPAVCIRCGMPVTMGERCPRCGTVALPSCSGCAGCGKNRSCPG